MLDSTHWLTWDSHHFPIRGELMVIGDAGVDYFDLTDELTLEWWTLYAYLRRN